MLAKLIGIVLINHWRLYCHHCSLPAHRLSIWANLSPDQTRHRRCMYCDRLAVDQKRSLTEKSVLSQTCDKKRIVINELS